MTSIPNHQTNAPTEQTSTSSVMQKLRQYALPVMIALTPAAFNTACDSDDPDPIEQVGDTPANKAKYMEDVVIRPLAGGVATMDYEAVWKEGSGYELQPKSMVNLAKAIAKLEDAAAIHKKNKEEMTFSLYYDNNATDQNSRVRITWIVPYTHLKELSQKGSTNINLNSSEFDNYVLKNNLSAGSPKATISKNTSGYLEVLAADLKTGRIVQSFETLNPFIFGK